MNELSLTDYLKDNQVLLSSLAVFATIATLTQSLETKWLGGIMSFFCIAAMVIIWYEINTACQKPPATKTKLLRYIMQMGFFALVAYWLVNFRTFWKLFLVFPVMFGIAYWLITMIKKNQDNEGVFKKMIGIKECRTTIQDRALDVMIAIILLIAFLGAVLISVPINIIADGLATIK